MTHVWMPRYSLVLCTALAALLSGCGGCNGPGSGCQADGECASNETCQDGACVPRNTTTSSSSGGLGAYCDMETPCPSVDQTCVLEVNLCVSRHECDDATTCQPGQECRDFNGDGYRDCGFPGCSSDAECVAELGTCPAGKRARCVARACGCQPACGADCPMGKVCCGVGGGMCGAQDACCVDDPGPCPGTTCNPGFEAVAAGTPAWQVDACGYDAAQCSCRELPPLPLGVIGNPSAIGLDGTGRLWAAAYNYGPYEGDVPADPPYGDLVVGSYNTSRSAFDWTFVDGVPLGAPLEGGPSGPRGGVKQPGPDVGRYLDMAVTSGGVVHVVYQDRSAGSLRYARVDGTNITRFTLDATRETGVYPSIALDPSTNAPRVAWLTRRDASGTTPKAILRFAAANDGTPGAASDFVVHNLKETDLTTVACEGGCETGKKCRDPGDPMVLPTCVAVGTGCSGCGMSQFCTAAGCADELAGSGLQNPPVGPGVYASLVVRADGKPVLAVHDTTNGSLTVYTTQGGDPPNSPQARFSSTVVTAAGQTVGLWPAAAVDGSGQTKVVHVNDTTHALTITTFGGALNVVGESIVDDAARVSGMATDIHRLAEPALVIRGDGAEVVAYQDGTTGELLMATRSSGTGPFTRMTLAGGGTPYNGTYGFSTDAAARANSAPVISTFKRNADPTPPEDGLALFNFP